MIFETDEQTQQVLDRILSSDSDDFIHLLELANLDPRNDLKFRNLSHLDFGEADLRGVSFKGADLTGSLLDLCTIDSTTEFEETKSVETLWPPTSNFGDDGRRYRVLLHLLTRPQAVASVRALRSFRDIAALAISSTTDAVATAGTGAAASNIDWLYVLADLRDRSQVLLALEGRTKISAIFIDSEKNAVSIFNFWPLGYTNSISNELGSHENVFSYVKYYIGNTVIRR